MREKQQAQFEGDYDWMLEAICRGKETNDFFPDNGAGVIAAKRICASCVVREECLEYALVNRIDKGVWGGASERERLRIIKQQEPAS